MVNNFHDRGDDKSSDNEPNQPPNLVMIQNFFNWLQTRFYDFMGNLLEAAAAPIGLDDFENITDSEDENNEASPEPEAAIHIDDAEEVEENPIPARSEKRTREDDSDEEERSIKRPRRDCDEDFQNEEFIEDDDSEVCSKVEPASQSTHDPELEENPIPSGSKRRAREDDSDDEEKNIKRPRLDNDYVSSDSIDDNTLTQTQDITEASMQNQTDAAVPRDPNPEPSRKRAHDHDHDKDTEDRKRFKQNSSD